MMSGMGMGALVGALTIASLGKVKCRGFALAASGVLSGGILLGFSAMAYLIPVYSAFGIYDTDRIVSGSSYDLKQ